MNDNGALDSNEVGSRLHVCEGSINATARNHFLTHVYDVGLVQTLYYCNANPVGNYVGGLGTGWIANNTTIVSNAHVVPKTSTHSCNGGPQALELSGIRVYFPKLGISADSMLRMGLPHAGGALPNSTDSFDEVTIDAIDRTPEAVGASARADLAFLRMSTGMPAGRQALTLSADNPLVDTSPSVPRMGDELFGIHYALGFGPRLAVSSIFQTFTCNSYQGANNPSNYDADTHCRSLTTGLGVSPGAHLTQIYGYGDHGASGSPVFDRFGRVSGVLTWGQSGTDSPYNMLQSARDVGVFLAAPRDWNTDLSE